MEQERKYDKVIKLLTDTTKNFAELNDILKSPADEELTEDEKKNLQLQFIKLAVVMREFGKK